MKQQAPTHTKWIRVAPNVYRHPENPLKYRLKIASGSARVKGATRPQPSKVVLRHPDDDEATFVLRAGLELDAMRKTLSAPVSIRAGSLRDGMARYLKTLVHGSSVSGNATKALEALCAAPLDPAHPTRGTYGELPMASLTREQLARVVAYWRARQGARKGSTFAAASVRRYVGIVRQMYDALAESETAFNPAAKSKQLRMPKLPKWERRDIGDEDVEWIFDRGLTRVLRGKQLTKVRLRVMLETGLAQASLMRIGRGDLDLDGRQARRHPEVVGAAAWFHPRYKGDGVPGVWMPLSDRGVAAFRDFAAANAFGTFSVAGMRDVWVRAIRRAAAAIEDLDDRAAFLARLPTHCHPYDLRHTFATNSLATEGGSESGTAYLIQHAPGSDQTARYTVGARALVAARSVAALNRHRPAPLRLVDKPVAKLG